MLRTEVRGVIPEAKRIVLDLAGVTNMDSSGLGALVSLYVSAKGQNCEFKVIHLNQRLQELFRLTKLASVFQGRDDLPWG
jgi:anti-sigma B factor antagonist